MPRHFFSDNPAKRAVERTWLYFTPVWGAIAAVVMLTGAAEQWRDAALLGFGGALCAAAFLLPLWFRSEAERAMPLWQTTAFKMSVSVVGFSLCMNYTATPFFFDVLHMHFGFQSTINIQHNPVFLYLLTVPYFATYCVLLLGGYRLLAGLGKPFAWVARIALPMLMAFFETLLNANPWMRRLFCYDDAAFALSFGTLSYRLAFVFTLPMWLRIDEHADARQRVTLARVVVWVAAAIYGYSLCLDGLRYWVAPHLTAVVEGANGLRDYGTSCLLPP